MQMPAFFQFDNRRYQNVGSGARPGSVLYTDGRQNFVEAASGIVEFACPLYAIVRCLVAGSTPITVKIGRDDFGARAPAVGNVGLVLPVREPGGKLFSRLWYPLSHAGRAETW